MRASALAWQKVATYCLVTFCNERIANNSAKFTCNKYFHYLKKKMPIARWRYLAPNQRCILAVRGGHLNQRRALWLEPLQASLPSSVVAR